jgi:hypothetical protein
MRRYLVPPCFEARMAGGDRGAMIAVILGVAYAWEERSSSVVMYVTPTGNGFGDTTVFEFAGAQKAYAR